MLLSHTAFRAYDIRGEAFIDFDEVGFFHLGYCLGLYLQKKHQVDTLKVLVSGDGRQSQAKLAPSLIAGLQANGNTLVWGGTVPTPLNYLAFHESGFDAAVQISASHNPSQDNGLKITDKNGAVSGQEIQDLWSLTQSTPALEISQPGHYQTQDLVTPYQAKLQQITPAQAPWNIIVDGGNAIGGSVYPAVLESFGHQVEVLFGELDTTFPNHQPDPERPENLQDLQKALKPEAHQLGLAFDGDGDRVGVALPDGQILNADKIMYALACDFLTRNPGEKIVLDAMTSQTLIDKLRGKGAQVIVSKTGHSFIEHAMTENNALLGGEQSGHFMFGENFYGHDDALLASLRFIQALQADPGLIDEVTTNWPELQEYSEKITVPEQDKFIIMDRLTQTLKNTHPDANLIDGIRLDFGKGQWGIIRASNTSPKIAIRIEASNQKALEDFTGIFQAALEEAQK